MQSGARGRGRRGSLSTAPAAYFFIPPSTAAFSPAGRSFLTTHPHATLFILENARTKSSSSVVKFVCVHPAPSVSASDPRRMSKYSTATAPKNPTPLPAKSAWARAPRRQRQRHLLALSHRRLQRPYTKPIPAVPALLARASH